MPKVSFIGKPVLYYKGKKIPSGYTLIKHDPKYDLKTNSYAENINEREIKNDKNHESLITMEVNYRARTLDQNNLMWALYAIEVNEHNVDMVGDDSQVVTDEELYRADVINWGVREYITVPLSSLYYYQCHFKILEIKNKQNRQRDEFFDVWSDIGKEYINSLNAESIITLTGIRGTSEYNTVEMARHIDGILNRILSTGLEITEPEQIKFYWIEWKQFLNDSKIVLYNKLMTQSEYRAAVPLCEICGIHLQEGTEYYHGNIHHIKAIGMGGDRKKEKKRTTTMNWLHICQKDHKLWHDKGEAEILKKAPYLSYKIKKAKRTKFKEVS